MSTLSSFVDIHCHLLPQVDDGASSWDQSLAMAQMAVADGISTIIVTPHQLGNYPQNSGVAVRERTKEFQILLDRRNVPLKVLPGGDVRIEPDMIGKIRTGDVLTLGDRGRHVLLELPHEVYLPLDRFLPLLRGAGLVGILSHPERNQGILRQPNVVEPLVEAGCLMQVTAGSLKGTFGPQVQKLARSLLERQLVHFIATDAHGDRRRRPLLRRAFDCACGLVGEDVAMDLCCRNPAAVAAGRDIEPTRRRTKQGRRFAWLPWNKAA